jgi:acid stress-induced BolA-like protein IbaG/YrbA
MSHLTRDAPSVLANFKEKDNRLYALKPCSIQIPKRFSDRNLAGISTDVFIYGIYALIVEDKYAVSNVTAMVQINPTKITTVKVKGTEYHNFQFDAGTAVISNLDVVKRNLLIYNVLDEFIIKGKIPWYLNYDDLGQLFDRAKNYADSNVGLVPEIFELIVSMISRTHQDRTKYFRTSINSPADINKTPEYVALSSVFYSSTNTLNKLAGNYFSDGVASALVTPTEETERLETLLRL